MKELPPELYKRCRILFGKCEEFDIDETLRNVFDGTGIKDYSKYVKDAKNRETRIDNCINGLKDKSNQGRSVLASFLEILAKRYPDGDDTRADLEGLARELHALAQVLLPLRASSISLTTEQLSATRSKNVLVIWGQNEAAKIETFDFLKGAGLSPIGLSQVVERSRQKSSPVDEVLRVAFTVVQAVIVLLINDDVVMPKAEYQGKGDKKFIFQPRPEILFIAGVAFAIEPNRTIVVALGKLRFFQDVLSRHIMVLTNKDEDREELISRLKIADCEITENEWYTRGDFNNPGFN